MKTTRLLATCLTASLLGACSATTSFQSSDPAVTVKVNQDNTLALSQPIQRTYPTTSFGQYHFKAYKQGAEPMYGLIPLKFNGGYLLADILFFAPATFFNLREVYPLYEFDTEAGVVRYKKKQQDAWMSYKPTAAETDRARKYFTSNTSY